MQYDINDGDDDDDDEEEVIMGPMRLIDLFYCHLTR